MRGLRRHRGVRSWMAILLLVAAGCEASRGGKAATAPVEGEAGPLAKVFGPTPERSGAQLWSDNCTRCHYVRQPDYYSGVQWDLVTQHMRLRANLTGVEERKIVQFLKAGSGAEE
jgi:hypothetical protein